MSVHLDWLAIFILCLAIGIALRLWLRWELKRSAERRRRSARAADARIQRIADAAIRSDRVRRKHGFPSAGGD